MSNNWSPDAKIKCNTLFFKKKKNFLFSFRVWPINNVGVVSGEQWRDSAMHIHVSILPSSPLQSKLPDNI